MGTEIWDEPEKCAYFIERFTSHTLSDSEKFMLEEYTRNDLEGLINFLHGFYSQLIMECPTETREAVKCSSDDVLRSMALASSLRCSGDGRLVLNAEVWDVVKDSPYLLNLLTRFEVS